MSTISNNTYFYSASTIRSALERAISSVSDNIACYCADPVSDFTRNRKLNCSDLIHYILHLSNKTIQSDMMNYFSDIDDMPLHLLSLSNVINANLRHSKECFHYLLLILQTIKHIMVTIFLPVMVLISISFTTQKTRRHITSIHLQPEDTISSISMHFTMC